MSHKKVLRYLVAAEILLVLIVLAVESLGEKALPIEIQQYKARNIQEGFTTVQDVGLGIGILFFIGVIVGWIGLWRLWRPARFIYTVTRIMGVFLFLLLDSVVYSTSVGAIFNEYSILAAGAILGLIFCSDLSLHFNKNTGKQRVGHQPPALPESKPE